MHGRLELHPESGYGDEHRRPGPSQVFAECLERLGEKQLGARIDRGADEHATFRDVRQRQIGKPAVLLGHVHDVNGRLRRVRERSVADDDALRLARAA